MTLSTRLAVTGFLATGVTYGPGRVGFGLFLPQFRDAFALSSQAAGLIAGGAFAAYVVALLGAGGLTAKWGPRAPVVLAALLVSAGFALVAASNGVAMLALGVILAGASAGFSWSPFNNAGNRAVPAERRNGMLSVVSTGTTIGVALAGVLALVAAFTGFHWRIVWWVFGLSGMAVALAAAFGLRDVAGSDGHEGLFRQRHALMSRDLLPLCVVGFVFGVAASVFLSFATDWITRAGPPERLPRPAVGPVIFISFGIVGLIGLLTGRIENRLGLVPLLRVIFCATALSLGLLALAPQSLLAVAVAGGLMGGCVMTFSAVLSFWSARLFPSQPSSSFTLVLVTLAVGAVLGPAAMGWTMDNLGAPAGFLTAGALALGVALGMRAHHVRRDAAA